MCSAACSICLPRFEGISLHREVQIELKAAIPVNTHHSCRVAVQLRNAAVKHLNLKILK